MSEGLFLIIDVPAAGTVLGALTQAQPGRSVDLIGRLDAHEGHVYAIDFIVEPIGADEAGQAAELLRPLYERFDELPSPEGSWHVRGRVPLAAIQAPALRMIAGLHGLMDMPWLRIEDGRVRATLRAKSQDGIDMLRALVRSRLDQLGVDASVEVAELDDAPYEARRQRLQQLAGHA